MVGLQEEDGATVGHQTQAQVVALVTQPRPSSKIKSIELGQRIKPVIMSLKVGLGKLAMNSSGVGTLVVMVSLSFV